MVYYVSITFFPHVHHIENDVVIVHSHPFSSGQEHNPGGHHHSHEAFTLIRFLSEFLTTPVAFMAIPAAITIILGESCLTPYRRLLPVAPPFSSRRLRAPPLFAGMV